MSVFNLFIKTSSVSTNSDITTMIHRLVCNDTVPDSSCNASQEKRKDTSTSTNNLNRKDKETKI